MLTIENIDHIVGLSVNGNRINGFRLDNDSILSLDYYVFVIKRDYNDKKIEVWLDRHRNEYGKYKMFVMGWAAATTINVIPNDLCGAFAAAVCVRDCLQLLDKC